MRTLWMEIRPGPERTRVVVQDGPKQTWLRARLPHSPSDPRAIACLCEALALWSGQKVCVALVVEGSDVFCATRAWLDTFETLSRPPRVEIHFVSTVRPARDRHLEETESRDELDRYEDLRQRLLSEVR